MNVRTLLILAGTVLVSFVANSPLWLVAKFAKQDMEVPILTWWLIAAFVIGLVTAFFSRRRFTERFFLGALPAFVGVQAVVLVRIVFDVVDGGFPASRKGSMLRSISLTLDGLNGGCLLHWLSATCARSRS